MHIDTHNIECEQWGLGTIWLDGQSLNSTRKVLFNNTGLEGEHRHLSGRNLQIHQQIWKHLGKLQRVKHI